MKKVRIQRTTKKFGRIAVLLGGPSSEREISLKSGETVYNALKRKGHRVIAIDVVDDWEERLKRAKVSVAFIALHGKFGEDGTIQRILEHLQIPYTGSGVEASRLAMNKVASRGVFRRVGISTPEYRVRGKGSTEPLDGIVFPVVVKPSSQGSSIGLTIVEEHSRLWRALDLAYSFDDEIIIDQYIRGKEITVGILNEQALPVIQIAPKRKFYDYKAKYTTGLTEYLVPAPITRKAYTKAQELGMLAHKALGCRAFSRVDMILEETGRVLILEVNSIPGLTSTSLLPKAAAEVGIDFAIMCEMLIESALLKG